MFYNHEYFFNLYSWSVHQFPGFSRLLKCICQKSQRSQGPPANCSQIVLIPVLLLGCECVSTGLCGNHYFSCHTWGLKTEGIVFNSNLVDQSVAKQSSTLLRDLCLLIVSVYFSIINYLQMFNPSHYKRPLPSYCICVFFSSLIFTQVQL